MTTRRPAKPQPWRPVRFQAAFGHSPDAYVPPRRASGVPPAWLGTCADVSPPASVVTPAGNRVPDSTAGRTAAPKGPVTPFAQAPSPSQMPPPGREPRPCRKMFMSHGRACSLGSARGGVTSSPGTPESVSYPLSDRHPTNVPTASDRTPKEITGRRGESPISPSEPAREAKETRNQTAQMRAPLKDTAERDEEGKQGKERTRRRAPTPDASLRATNGPTMRTI